MRIVAALSLAFALGGCANADVVEWADYRAAYRPSQVRLASTEPTLIESVDAGCGDPAALAAAWSPAEHGWPSLTFVAARTRPTQYDYRLRLDCSPAGDGATRVRAIFLVSSTVLSSAQGRTPAGAAPGSENYRRFAQQMLVSMMPWVEPRGDED